MYVILDCNLYKLKMIWILYLQISLEKLKKKRYNFKFENILENADLSNLSWVINVPVTCPVSNRRWGLQNEKSSIPLQLGVVINRNLILLVGRAWKGRSGRHRNSISRQVIILLRAPNLWSGILRYPLNHPFHLSVPLSCVFSFTRFPLPRFYKCLSWKTKSRSHRRSAFKIASMIDSSFITFKQPTASINCGHDWMLTFYIESLNTLLG